MSRKHHLWAAAAAALVFAALAVGSAATKSPWSDEAWFAQAGLNLAARGEMTTPVLETAGTKFKGLDRHTYWVMPLHLVAQAGWYKVFGFSLLSMRMLSAVFGVLALLAWYVVVRALAGERRVALLTVVLLACDYIFVQAASFGRMDMMSHALGALGLAAYLHWRERDLTRAVLAGQSLIAASGLTHPNGGVMFFAGLLFLTLYLDRGRLRPRHLALAAVPYLLGALGWGAYILQAPSDFVAQFTANASTGGRMESLTSPLGAIKKEIVARYLTAFGLGPHSSGSSGPVWVKSFVLLAYVVALAGCLSVRDIRAHKGYRALLVLTGTYFLVLTFFDGQKLSFYLVHIVPLYTALVAAFAHWCYSRRAAPRSLLALAVCGLLAIQLGGVLYRMKVNAYGRSYVPAVNFLKAHAREDSVVMGSAVLGFEFGYERVVDDVRFGFNSGRRADFIVINDVYEDTIRYYRAGGEGAELARHVNRLLERDFELVYDQNFYQIYARREAVAGRGGRAR
ncbi:MAG TPA: glycosyltransferase family 39 protein [Pyrinomonadaceae bacterium]|nr:glycosyltransferase family 39 protein [Pyrinomonadaceae bacterium]